MGNNIERILVYLISDVHLGYFQGEKNRQIESLLLAFLETIRPDCKSLVIVGDLFDYWFDYNSVIPKEFYKVVTKLAELRESNIEIIYLMGNHDFGHYRFFEDELKIKVYEKDIVKEFEGKKFYISHGDGKIKGDIGYLILKAILRNKLSRFLFRLIHPDLGIWLATRSSRNSRKYTEKRKRKDFDSLAKFAKKKIESGFDFVIMGHSHKVEFIRLGNGYYINLGDWLSKPQVAIFDGNQIELMPVEKVIENKLKV